MDQLPKGAMQYPIHNIFKRPQRDRSLRPTVGKGLNYAVNVNVPNCVLLFMT